MKAKTWSLQFEGRFKTASVCAVVHSPDAQLWVGLSNVKPTIRSGHLVEVRDVTGEVRYGFAQTRLPVTRVTVVFLEED